MSIFAPFVRSAYNYDVDAASDLVGLTCEDPSLAQQQFREETDINTIVRNFLKTGVLPDTVKMPSYGDFTGPSEYKAALDFVLAAEDVFMSLPADVRREFNDDPGEYASAPYSDEGVEKLIKLGLVSKQQVAGGSSAGQRASDSAPASEAMVPPEKGVKGVAAQ